LQNVLNAYAKKRRNDAESTKQGYGKTTSSTKRDNFIAQAEQAEEMINRMAQIFW
jgi:hypothetical protein